MESYMKTFIYKKNNLNYQYIYCYLTEEEFKRYVNDEANLWLEKEYYESLTEANYQSSLQKDTNKIRFMQIGICIYNNIFDLLSTEDTEKLRVFYERNKRKLDKEIADSGIEDKDRYIIDTYYTLSNPGIIRDSKKQESDGQILKCLTSRQIIIYKIRDLSVIDCYQFINV